MLSTLFLMSLISILLLPACIWLYAVVDVLKNEFCNIGIKMAWLLLLIFFPPLATIFYFLMGRGQRITNYKVGKTVSIIIILIPVAMIIAIYIAWFSSSPPHPDIPQIIQI